MIQLPLPVSYKKRTMNILMWSPGQWPGDKNYIFFLFWIVYTFLQFINSYFESAYQRYT